MELQPGGRLGYALAGNAVVTLEGKTSRFTYRIEASKKPGSKVTHWVYVLNGPNNETDHRFIGGITSLGFYRSNKSPISAGAPSVKAFAWWMRHIDDSQVRVYHSGSCGRCGRTLTTPESVRTGIGPTCAARRQA